jgi:hypothetical protein
MYGIDASGAVGDRPLASSALSKMTKESINSDNHDIYVTLLNVALTLKKIADIIRSEERNILKALENIDNRMDSPESPLGNNDSSLRRDDRYP